MRDPAPSSEQLNDEVNVLLSQLAFKGAVATRLRALALASERVSFDAGATLFRQGDLSDSAYVVLSGSADVLVNSISGEIKVATIERNTMVGTPGVLCGDPWNATLRAITPLETLSIHKDELAKLFSEIEPGWEEILAAKKRAWAIWQSRSAT